MGLEYTRRHNLIIARINRDVASEIEVPNVYRSVGRTIVYVLLHRSRAPPVRARGRWAGRLERVGEGRGVLREVCFGDLREQAHISVGEWSAGR